jgi:hypothetical protein
MTGKRPAAPHGESAAFQIRGRPALNRASPFALRQMRARRDQRARGIDARGGGPGPTPSWPVPAWQLIPVLADADSRRGFPNRLKFGSTWRAGGGSPWRQRLVFGVTMTRGLFGRRRSIRRTGRRRAGCWLLRRSTTEPRATEAAKIGGVGLQVARDWVLKFNARGPDGLIDHADARRARTRSDPVFLEYSRC